MSLARAAQELGWPAEQSILDPPGAGAAVSADLARKKIGRSLASLDGARDARIGVLSLDPTAKETQAPLALVCAFDEPAPAGTLKALHRLAWNFSRTPLLLTVDARGLRAFTCCEPPHSKTRDGELPAEIREARYNFGERRRDAPPMIAQADQALHWLELVSGRFVGRNKRRFRRDKRADTLLLKNLRVVRSRLHRKGLGYDIVHDLLARIIFVQFLFDRRDSEGNTALNREYLHRLYEEKILSNSYESFGEILTDHADCYRLFWYLDERFNGDLFPGQGTGDERRQRAREAESRLVESRHLDLLSEFIMGRMELRSGQYSLWPMYSFDVIPLEFISSIYEAFVTPKTGTVYTPAHLVDFVLDGVLPWEGTEWDLKILDPACGSGIFLVKAFQRLIHRWKQAHGERRIDGDTLRTMMEENLFGVDHDPHAVRTASFSLYLAMCDEIDPRHYWTDIRFPNMRGERLISKDFFDEQAPGLRTAADAGRYDIAVGNPPWGRNSATSSAKEWARERSWPVSYGDIGPLFLVKSAALVKTSGQVSLIQPAGNFLFNISENSRKYRGRLFKTFHVSEIVNFSALRFGLFKKAVGPAVLVTLQPAPPSGAPLTYVAPKPSRNSGSDDYMVLIDPYDVHALYPGEQEEDPAIWSTFMWGGRRDLAFLRRLKKWPTLEGYRSSGRIVSRQGIIRGDRKKKQCAILNRPMLADSSLPEDVFLSLSPERLESNTDPWTDNKSSTDYSAFQPSQLLIKMAWTVDRRRFQAVLVDPPGPDVPCSQDPSRKGILCSRDYVSVSAHQRERDDELVLLAACLSYNSKLAVHHLLLRSARLASYRPSPNIKELLGIPIPELDLAEFDEAKSLDDVDRLVQAAFDFTPAEQVLIEDAMNYALADFKGGTESPGRLPTRRTSEEANETELHAYCAWFLRVLRAGFGERRSACATIFEETFQERLPVRLVAVHLGWERERDVSVEPLEAGSLIDRLKRVYDLLAGDIDVGIGFRRVARVFDVWSLDGRRVPTIVLVKPDQARYWSRSIALRDADDVSQEIVQHMQATDVTGGTEER